MNSIYMIKEKNGMKKDFSLLLSMMDYARFTSIQEVENLSVEKLDYRCHDEANSIGMLLAHFDAVEKIYQALTFEQLTDEEIEAYASELEPALSLGSKAAEKIKGNSVEYYLENLQRTRKVTIEQFKKLDEEWLYDETDWWYGEKGNNFFKWFHVFEDEINHRGQIRMIKKLYTKEYLPTIVE
ncbi:DinB family protein [Rossellomorea sp. SC111]|uniref:DinB family protein n=1 Tax=Rossellomorea sp. SC111 TaxID=2968985 RepID=UPI00215B011E|nr:DinB family protein [Rossellomorea sp. SC111]MCR8847181.1 DinB family protein [Rossellomorea sp. SC111]